MLAIAAVLHGDATGSVDRWHNAPGDPIVVEHLARAAFEEESMDQRPYDLDLTRRDLVLQAIQGVGAHRGWKLLAARVRSNHVHTVVEAEAQPERVIGCVGRTGRKRRARHGSTRWLWKAASCLGGHPVSRCRAG